MRSFVAIELPESVKSSLAECQRELKKSGADVRWVKPEGIHLTLRFLGDVAEKDIGLIVAKLEGACKKYSAFRVLISEVGVFPNYRSPRVLWVGVQNDKVIERLQGDISDALASLGFKKEERKFSPHLTLGRVKSFRGKSELLAMLDSYKVKEFGQMEVMSIALMKSELRPDGARYTKTAEIIL